jgi:hypothetical protein
MPVVCLIPRPRLGREEKGWWGKKYLHHEGKVTHPPVSRGEKRLKYSLLALARSLPYWMPTESAQSRDSRATPPASAPKGERPKSQNPLHPTSHTPVTIAFRRNVALAGLPAAPRRPAGLLSRHTPDIFMPIVQPV